jgi:hypothetical protein
MGRPLKNSLETKPTNTGSVDITELYGILYIQLKVFSDACRMRTYLKIVL